MSVSRLAVGCQQGPGAADGGAHVGVSITADGLELCFDSPDDIAVGTVGGQFTDLMSEVG